MAIVVVVVVDNVEEEQETGFQGRGKMGETKGEGLFLILFVQSICISSNRDRRREVWYGTK